MSHRLQSNDLREQLVRQLVLFGEERSQFLDSYFPLPGRDRSRMDRLLSDYTNAVEKLLSETDDPVNSSVALIGSRVRIAYMDDPDFSAEAVTIVHPDETDVGEDCISFLSPVGKQLLLRSAGEVVQIETPAGELQVRIEAIDNNLRGQG